MSQNKLPNTLTQLPYVEEDSDSDCIDEEEVDTIYDPSVVKKDYVPFSVVHRSSTVCLPSLI